MLLFVWLFVVWIIALYLIFKPSKRESVYQDRAQSIATALGYKKVKSKVNDTSHALSAKIYILLIVGTFLVVFLISVAVGNYFFMALGGLLSYMLPLQIIKSMQHKKRDEMLFEIPEFLKIFSSKLFDFSNTAHAMKEALLDYHGPLKPLFQRASDSLQMGFPLDAVLIELQEKIAMRRFNEFVDKLRTAEENGFTVQAIDSLKDTIRGMAEDALCIKELQVVARAEMRTTKIQAAMCAAIPLMLGFINTNNVNIFTDTLFGQIYIVFFLGVILFCIIKKTDCLTLNLNDL